MKLISRIQERRLLARRGESRYLPWSEWEDCEGSEGLTAKECMRCVRDWLMPEDKMGVWVGEQVEVRTLMGDREQYRIVPDGFDVADYNQRTKE